MFLMNLILVVIKLTNNLTTFLALQYELIFVSVCLQAAAMAWRHKTVIKEYEMNKNDQPDDVEKYRRTDTSTPDEGGADFTTSTSPSQMSDP